MSTVIDDIEVVETTTSVPAHSDTFTVTVDAPSGKKVMGGGAHCDTAFLTVRYSYPSADGASWNFEVVNSQATSQDLVARVICFG